MNIKDAQREYRLRPREKAPASYDYLQLVQKQQFHSTYRTDIGNYFDMDAAQEKVKQKMKKKREKRMKKLKASDSAPDLGKLMPEIDDHKFKQVPYSNASAVPFMEPYIATEKTFDEYMVLKKKGQKELDGNMSTIARAKKAIEGDMNNNFREQDMLAQRKEQIKIEQTLAARKRKKQRTEGDLAISAYVGYRKGKAETEYSKNHVTQVGVDTFNPKKGMPYANSAYPGSLTTGFQGNSNMAI